MKSDFSCKNCQKRNVGCHGTCEEYLKNRIENAKKVAYATARKHISREEAAAAAEQKMKYHAGRKK